MMHGASPSFRFWAMCCFVRADCSLFQSIVNSDDETSASQAWELRMSSARGLSPHCDVRPEKVSHQVWKGSAH